MITVQLAMLGVHAASTSPALRPGVLDGYTIAAAYGTRRLLSAYGNGPALDLIRESDSATATFSFADDGNIGLNGSGQTLATWLGSGVARVSQVYDQKGGGNHMTQATATSRPGVATARMTGNALSLIWDSNVLSDSGGRDRWMLVPGAVTFPHRGHVIGTVMRCAAATVNQGIYEYRDNTGTGSNRLSVTTPSSGNRYVSGGANKVAPQSPFVLLENSKAGTNARRMQMDGATGTSSLTTDFTLGGIGGSLGAFSLSVTSTTPIAGSGFRGEIAAHFIMASALTDGEQDALTAALHTEFGIAPTGNLIFCEGDSLTAGSAAPGGFNYVQQMIAGLSRQCRVYNSSQSGSQMSGAAARWTDAGQRVFRSGERNIYLLWMGRNDIANGNKLAATVFGADDVTANTIRKLVADAKALGYEVIVGTAIVGNDLNQATVTLEGVSTSKDAERLALNALIRSNAAALGYTVADFAAARSGFYDVFANRLNTTYFATDAVHLKAAGFGDIAGVALGAVEPLLV